MPESLVYYIVQDFLQLFVCVIGIIANFICVIVLTRPVMRSSVNVILLGLALADNICLVTQIFLMFSDPAFLKYLDDLNYKWEDFYVPFIYSPMVFGNTFGQTASTYFTVAITLERFVVVCWPLHAWSICTVKNAWRVVGSIVLVSFLYSLPSYFESETVPYISTDNITVEYRLVFTDFGISYTYQVIYMEWGYAIVSCGIPFFVLLSFNTGIYVMIQKANRSRQSMTQSQTTEISLSRMLLCVVAVFGICYFPSAYFYFFVTENFPAYHELFRFIIFAKAVNSAVNFIIYCAMSQKFRTTLKGLCTKPSPGLNYSARAVAGNRG